MAKEVTVTLTEEQLAPIKALMESADALSTAVVSGRTQGTIKIALEVARALSDIKRKKVLG